ncbi:MAG: FHA domain-containing protein [Jatrophihabitantaceae bacterium]
MTTDPPRRIPLALLVPLGGAGEHPIPIYDRLFIGRECAGLDEAHRFLIDDEAVSRNHLELRLDPDQNQAWVIDRSTNGTRVNGGRIERSIPVRIRPGDRIRVGPIDFDFRSELFTSTSAIDLRSTAKSVTITQMVMVVGDIASFAAISEYTDDGVLLDSIDRLYSGLHRLLGEHHGTLSNYVGDAFFGTWEIPDRPDAAYAAVRFALAAVDYVNSVAPSLPLRDPLGQPVRMGWSVGSGPAALSALTGMLVTVLGDATNVTFRLSGIAGRGDWPDVVVTEAVQAGTADAFVFTAAAEVQVKGRTGAVRVCGVSGVKPPATVA